MKVVQVKRGIGLSLLLVALFFALGSLTSQAWADESYSTAIAPVSPDEPEGDVVTSPNTPEALRTGKIIVINESSYTVNVFLDGDLIWEALEPNYKLTIKKVAKGPHELYAETANKNKKWGPIQINLRRIYTWTLTD